MAWTKVKTTVVAGAALLLAAGTTTVAVKGISAYRESAQEDAVWSKMTRIDSRLLDDAPPVVSIRPAPAGKMRGGTVWSSNGKKLGFSSSVSSLLADAYGISESRMVNPAALPKDKYDFIVSLPEGQSEALQAEIKKKLGLVAKTETRETDVLLLKVATANAPGLAPGATGGGGGSMNSGAGKFTCNNGRISGLVNFLERRLKIPVIDQTGLTAKYDIDLEWEEPSYQNPNPEALKKAVLDTLGLELTPATESIEMLVVSKTK